MQLDGWKGPMKPLSAVAIAVLFTLSACNRAQNQATDTAAIDTAATGDPANGNLAPVDQAAAEAPAADNSAPAPSYALDQVADASSQEVQAPDPPPSLPDYS